MIYARITKNYSVFSFELQRCKKMVKFFRVENCPSNKMPTVEKNFECVICFKKFNRSTKLLSHRNLHLNIFPYICTICNRKYPSQKSLNFHAIKHNKPKYNCTKCKRTFFYNDKRKLHELICSREWKCACGKLFVKKRWYEKHLEEKIIEIKTKRPSLLFECQYCKKGMKSKRNLVVHEKSVHKK